jgi:UV DNA damage endonuclease
MFIRFGYVSHALNLWEGSPAKTMTFTRFKQLNKEQQLEQLKNVTEQNLQTTWRILHYNVGHEIELYRLSSSLVPLATHPEVNWDYLGIFGSKLKEIGAFIKKHNLRVSFHPNQYTLFTSGKPHITKNAVRDMEYHYNILEALGVEKTSLINIHVGGTYGDKPSAIERFHKNLKELPTPIKQKMTLENDDKTYTAEETLKICQHQGIPLLFDYHHHQANLSETPLEELLEPIFETWKERNLKPKVHLSSPKSESSFRSHSDYLSLDFVKPFFKTARELNRDFDVMIEAKGKDKALLQFVEEVSKLRGIKRASGGSIVWP